MALVYILAFNFAELRVFLRGVVKKVVSYKIQCNKCHGHRPACPKGRKARRERSVAVGVQSKRSEACPAIEDRVEGNP